LDIVETLQTEHAGLTAKLAELDERVQTERPVLVGQIGKLNKAIRALTKPTNATGERKPMSEAGKAAIKAGLERVRAAKLAATNGATPAPQPTAAGNVPETSASGKKPATVDKGLARAN
jgi:hypothetical protein